MNLTFCRDHAILRFLHDVPGIKKSVVDDQLAALAGAIAAAIRFVAKDILLQAVFPAPPDNAIAMLPIVLANVAEGGRVLAPISEAQARFVVGFADHAAPAAPVAPVALFSTPSEPPRQEPRQNTLLPQPF